MHIIHRTETKYITIFTYTL